MSSGLYEQGPHLMLVNDSLVQHLLLSRKSPNTWWANAKFCVIKCHEEGVYSKFCSSKRGEVFILWSYWEVFWRGWNLRWRQILVCFPPVVRGVLSVQSPPAGAAEHFCCQARHSPDFYLSFYENARSKVKVCSCGHGTGLEEELYAVQRKIHSSWGSKKLRPKILA